MPGTLENLAFSLERNLPDPTGDDVRAQAPVAQWSTTMGTDITQGDKRVPEIEDSNPLPATDGIYPASAWGNISDRAEDAPSVDDLESTGSFDTVDRSFLKTINWPLLAHLPDTDVRGREVRRARPHYRRKYAA
jgi:hypothetical protein